MSKNALNIIKHRFFLHKQTFTSIINPSGETKTLTFCPFLSTLCILDILLVIFWWYLWADVSLFLLIEIVFLLGEFYWLWGMDVLSEILLGINMVSLWYTMFFVFIIEDYKNRNNIISFKGMLINNYKSKYLHVYVLCQSFICSLN